MEESAGWGIQQQADTSTENQNQSTESHKVANTSSGNENHNKWLADNIAAQFERRTTSSIDYRITRVPDHIRSVNPQAYTPMVISIGPIHHFDEKLQTMEKHKVAYLTDFIDRDDIPIDLEEFVSIIKEMEETIRCCYAETSSRSMSSDDFVTMILLDAIFILELFLKYYYARSWERDDPIRPNQWMFPFARLELVLLENQLPFFVLEKLFNLAFAYHSNSPALILLTFAFFNNYNVQNMSPENVKIGHFTDLVRTFWLPLLSQPEIQFVVAKLLYSATQLHLAGVKFKVSSSECFLDLKFDFEKGVLKMPCLKLYNKPEALIRNLMALELFRHGESKYIMDYFYFLDFLVNTTKDMDLLCDKGIVVNYLSDNKAATTMVKNLCTNFSWSCMNSDYNDICRELNAFYQNPLRSWKAFLRHEYFSTPLKVASSIPGLILLVLTLLQTVFAILQVVFKR